MRPLCELFLGYISYFIVLVQMSGFIDIETIDS